MANDFSEYVQSKVEAKFKTAWTALHPSLKIIWENGKAKAGKSETCVEFSLLDNEDIRKDLGRPSRTHEYIGIININILVPLGTGTRKTRQYIDEICGFFRDDREDEIRYTNISYEKFGEVGDHFVSNVSINCNYRKTYTD